MRLPIHVRLLLSIAVLGAAAAVASLATFASFTSATSASSQSLATGTVSITLGSTDTLTIGASNLVPGDTIQRAVDVTNNGSTGTSAVGSITLTTSASPSSLLDTDATNGLQLVVDSCSVAWTQSGPPYTYSCSGTTSSVLASQRVIGSGIALSNMSSVTAGNTDHLRVTLTLPTTAPNTFQGLSSTLSFVFTANQRAAGSQ